MMSADQAYKWLIRVKMKFKLPLIQSYGDEDDVIFMRSPLKSELAFQSIFIDNQLPTTDRLNKISINLIIKNKT
jgi:hypothetical protein